MWVSIGPRSNLPITTLLSFLNRRLHDGLLAAYFICIYCNIKGSCVSPKVANVSVVHTVTSLKRWIKHALWLTLHLPLHSADFVIDDSPICSEGVNSALWSSVFISIVPCLQLAICAQAFFHSRRSHHKPALIVLAKWTTLIAMVIKATFHHFIVSVCWLPVLQESEATSLINWLRLSLPLGLCQSSVCAMCGPAWQPPCCAASSGHAEQVPRPPSSAMCRNKWNCHNSRENKGW